MTEEMEDEFYLQRLEAGLFTLQLIDCVMLEISTSPPPTVSDRPHTLTLDYLSDQTSQLTLVRSILMWSVGSAEKYLGILSLD